MALVARVLPIATPSMTRIHALLYHMVRDDHIEIVFTDAPPSDSLVSAERDTLRASPKLIFGSVTFHAGHKVLCELHRETQTNIYSSHTRHQQQIKDDFNIHVTWFANEFIIISMDEGLLTEIQTTYEWLQH